MKIAGYCFGLWSLVQMAGCASSDELFAEYDHYCESTRVALIANASSVSYTVRESARQESGAFPFIDSTASQIIWHPAVYFDFDRDELSEAEKVRLDDNIDVLHAHSDLLVQLRGFTDERGTVAYNRDLSRRRVQAVLRYIEESGISASRFTFAELGEALPISEKRRLSDFKINRRVEFFLLDSSGHPVPIIFAGPAN